MKLSADILAILQDPVGDPNLTPREREVARLAARGLKTSEIADELEIAVKTVEGHLHGVREKTGLDKAMLTRKLVNRIERSILR